MLQWVIDNSDHTNPVTPDPNAPVCQIPNWYNDTWCDNENNTKECNWDGGDCCKSTNPNKRCGLHFIHWAWVCIQAVTIHKRHRGHTAKVANQIYMCII